MKRKLTSVLTLYKRASDSCNAVVMPVVESGKEELLDVCRAAVCCTGNSEGIGWQSGPEFVKPKTGFNLSLQPGLHGF